MKAKAVQFAKKPAAPVSYELLAKNYQFYKLQIKELEKKAEKAKKELDAHILNSVEPDEKGNRFFRFSFEDENLFIVRQARSSQKVSIEKCKEVFASDVLGRIIKERTEEYLDEQELLALIAEEAVTMEEIEKITDVNTSYAIVVMKEKPKEDEESGAE